MNSIQDFYSFSFSGISDIHVHSTDSVSVNVLDVGISSVSPRSSPRVSDDPVVVASRLVISNQRDGVIEIGGAVFGI